MLTFVPGGAPFETVWQSWSWGLELPLWGTPALLQTGPPPLEYNT